MYFFAMETTRRRFASASFCFDTESPFRIALLSLISSAAVRER